MNHNHDNPGPVLSSRPKLKDYLPLAIVFAVIFAGSAALTAQANWRLEAFLSFSMGLFFLLFGLFKLLDLKNFAHGYREYDLIAKFFMPWGFIYPFLEVIIGSLYLARVEAAWLNWVTILLAIIICIGVGIKLAKHEVIQCACLGSILKVPITFISLAEYAAMGVMALAMLYI